MPYKYIAVKDKSGKCKVLKVLIKKKTKLTTIDKKLLKSIDTSEEQRRLLRVYNKKLEESKKLNDEKLIDYFGIFIKELNKKDVPKSKRVDPGVGRIINELDNTNLGTNPDELDELINNIVHSKANLPEFEASSSTTQNIIEQMLEKAEREKEKAPEKPPSFPSGEEESEIPSHLLKKPDMPLTKKMLEKMTPIGPRLFPGSGPKISSRHPDSIARKALVEIELAHLPKDLSNLVREYMDVLPTKPVLGLEDDEVMKELKAKKEARKKEIEKILPTLPIPKAIQDIIKEYAKATPEEIVKDISGGGSDDGLYNSQIDEMLKGDKAFLGTIPSDKIHELKPEHNKPFAYVMNLDTSKEPGSHWVAIYCDPILQKTLEYFDPFGKPPSDSWLRSMKRMTKQYPYMLKLKINSVPNQSVDSNNCGYISSWFLIQRLNGVPFTSATGFKESEQESNALNNEEKIKQFKNIFSYI